MTNETQYWVFTNDYGELCVTDRWDVAKHLPYDLIECIVKPVKAPRKPYKKKVKVVPEKTREEKWKDFVDETNRKWEESKQTIKVEI